MKLKILFIFCINLLSSCYRQPGKNDINREDTILFELMSPDSTHILFENKLIPTHDLNIFTYMYFYNGGGVGTADLNNDGLMDIVFTGNQVNTELYLNKGNLKFEAIGVRAGLTHLGWSTGVNFIDINEDGYLDIYITEVNNGGVLKGKNRLYVCTGLDSQGYPAYREEASKYGIHFSGYGTHSAFFDFDRDGDLDLYLLNHSEHKNGTFGERKVHLKQYHPTAGDRLYKNDHGMYRDITKESGIYSNALGYGLGIKVSDINMDGWPDVYIGNDFHENDYLYINQKNGTFADELDKYLMHTSRYTMGVDIADFNNDLYPDIFTLDMLPSDYKILKRSDGEDLYNIYLFKLNQGYNQQYSRNTLQLNRHNGFFSEIGTFSGVHASDWSWSTFFADMDNDGMKDIFISTGIPRRMNDIDYIDYIVDDVIQNNIRNKNFDEADLDMLKKLPEIKIENKFFINSGDLTFSDGKEKIKNDLPGFSNGAAFADLDNDGDIEIITNNINQPASIYKNNSVESGKKPLLEVTLDGLHSNKSGRGTKLIAFKGHTKFYMENYPERGFLSTMAGGIYIGDQEGTGLDSILVIWPDGKQQMERAFTINKNKIHIIKSEKNGKQVNSTFLPDSQNSLFKFNLLDSSLHHTENPFSEFDREALMPYMTTTEGPALAVTDLNKDGILDLFLGGSRYHPGRLFISNKGSWIVSDQPDIKRDSMYEDVVAIFADMNNDKFQDLVVGSGGNEFYTKSEYNLPRVYFNDGKNNFKRSQNAFNIQDQITASGILSFDFNHDSLVDLLVTARSIPWAYGECPSSKVFINMGDGRFENAALEYTNTEKWGMIKDVKAGDYDEDGDVDFILAADWEALKVLENHNGKFLLKNLPIPSGLWNSIELSDLDKDGDLDIVAGNLGLNSKFKASEKKPLRMYYSDFDKNEKNEQAITYYTWDQKEVPFATIKELHKQMPPFKRKFQFAGQFSELNANQVFGNLASVKVKYEVKELASCIFENAGKGKYIVHKLPFWAQLSAIKDLLVTDLDYDGDVDILPVSNYYDLNTQIGRLDADPGIILINEGRLNFSTITLDHPHLKNQSRRIKSLGNTIVVAKNNDQTILFSIDFLPN